VSLVLAALLVGVAGAARAQVALLPRTEQVVLGTGDAATDEVAVVRLQGGFALLWNDGAEAPAIGEVVHLQRLGVDAGAAGEPILHGVSNLVGLEAVQTDGGVVYGFVTQQPFQSPSIVARRHQGDALALTGSATFTDTAVEPFDLVDLGDDAAAALYGTSATVLDLGGGGGDEVALPTEESAEIAGMPAGDGDLFVFSPDPSGGAEPTTLVRYRVSGGAVVDGPDPAVVDSFASDTPLLIVPAGSGLRHLLAWQRPGSLPTPGRRYTAVFLGGSGSAQGDPFPLEIAGRPDALLEALAVDDQDVVWTLWRDGSELLLAAFEPGEPGPSALSVESGSVLDAALAVTGDGTALVAWIDGSDHTVRGQVFGECAGGTGGFALCLQQGRFLVELEFETAEGEEGDARPVPTRSVESGLFWFFTPDNWEFLVKVLAACPINDFYWVFAAPTTDIGFTLRVTDTTTQQQRTYVNPVGTLPTVINDTGAFACNGS
jgi:hypothetical protein